MKNTKLTLSFLIVHVIYFGDCFIEFSLVSLLHRGPTGIAEKHLPFN